MSQKYSVRIFPATESSIDLENDIAGYLKDKAEILKLQYHHTTVVDGKDADGKIITTHYYSAAIIAKESRWD